jgi:sigma-B regulation protein RsbU (phosphoserine phosphatase)
MNRVAPIDRLLMLVGLAGLGWGLWLLPRHHPDAFLDRMGSVEEVRQEAIRLVRQQGYALDSVKLRITIRRDTALLNSWQRRWGRPGLLQQLQAMPWLPAYVWEVQGGLSEEESPAWSVQMGSDKTVWAMRVDPKRMGLDQTLSADAAVTFDLSAPWGKVPDTLRRALLHPGPAEALAWARDQVAKGPGRHMRLQPDSVGLAESNLARVRFRGLAPTGDTLTVWVEVTATGVLQTLQVAWTKAEPPGQRLRSASKIDPKNWLTLATYVGLLLWLLGTFLRRLHRRLLDTQATLRDAVVGGLLLGAGVLSASLPGLLRFESVELRLVLVATSVLATGLLGLASSFVAASTSDALARDYWPEKLSVLSLLRNGQIRNVPVGRALLRAIAVGGMLLGLLATWIAVRPHVPLALEANTVETIVPGLTALMWLGIFGWLGLIQAYLLLAVVVRMRRLGRWALLLLVMIGWGLTSAFTVFQSDASSVHFGDALGLPGLWAVVLVGVLWRCEVVSCGLGLMMGLWLWESLPGWASLNGPFGTDGLMVLAAIGLLGGMGILGLVSRRVETDLPQYVPLYVQELARQERLQRELEIARQAQASLLPQQLPQVPGVAMAAFCLPAYEVGGDYYDVFLLPDGRLAVVIGDVSGKGIQAAFFMTLVKGYVRALSLSGDRPREVLSRLNRLFRAQAPRGLFVTMVYGIFDPETRIFMLSRAGHPPVLYRRACDGCVAALQPAGLGIGLADAELFDAVLEEQALTLEEGDGLLLYTDGVMERAGQQPHRWGIDWLRQWMAQTPSQPGLPKVWLDRLRIALQRQQQDKLSDDLTAIWLEVTAKS